MTTSALDLMLEQQRVPSTLLFVGGEQHLQDFVTQLMGEAHAKKIAANNHPDLHIYRPEGKSGMHPLASIRQLIDEVCLPPFEGPCKVFILHDAERMLPSSSNALLKTLEEPLEDTFFILLSHEPEALLPTIRSRCRTLLFTSKRELPENPRVANILETEDYAAQLQLFAQLEESLQGEDEAFIDYDPVLQQILEYYKEAPHPEKILALIDKCRFALARGTRLRVVLEYFFLSIQVL